MKKISLFFIALTIFACNSEPKKTVEEETKVVAASSSSASEFINGYSANKADYDAKYIDQIITVSGPVANAIKTEDGFNIEVAGEDASQTVSCSFAPTALKTAELPKVGEAITISGKCTGYSEEPEMGLKTVYLEQSLINK